MTKIEIRTITKAEFQNFEKSLIGVEIWDNEPGLLMALQEFVDGYEDDEIPVVGYFKDGALLGMIHYSEEDQLLLFGDDDDVPGEDDIQFTLVGTIFIHPNYRLRGIGKELIKCAIDESEHDWITASPIDEAARRFFVSLGFEQDVENNFTDNDWMLFLNKSIFNNDMRDDLYGD